MPRPLPIQSCVKPGCKDPKLLFFNQYIQPQQTKAARHSEILQSPQYRRLGCGSDSKIPVGFDSKGEPLKNAQGEVAYIQGCTKTKQGITLTERRRINGFGRFLNQSGSLANPQKGGLVVSNF